MTSAPGLVVVGASLAGIRSVQALRRRGYQEPITVIGAEPQLPYDRPPLSKDFLLGTLAATDLALASETEIDALGVSLRLGEPASALDAANHELTVGTERIAFRTLVIATGSRPRTIAGLGALAGVHTLRTLGDAEAIRAGLAAGARVAIIGGGFIGAEIASSARALGLEVTIIDPLPALMIRGLGAEIGGVLAARHADNGVKLRLGRGVARIEGESRVERVVLDDGSVIETDLVIVGIGVEPAVEWLAGSGLDVRAGVACDESLRAGDGIYAVGDVARFSTADGLRRLEHWTNAVDQATMLAGVLTGAAGTYQSTPYVWSDQLGRRLQVWGEVRPQDERVFLHGNSETDEFVAVFGGEGRLRSVVAFGARREAMRAQRLMRDGSEWQPGLGPRKPVA